MAFGAVGFEHKIMETYAGTKFHEKNLLKATVAVSLGQEWPEVSTHKECKEYATVRHDVAESDQGGAGGRLVGADEE